MKEKIKKRILKFFEILFLISLVISLALDIGQKFDLKEGSLEYNMAMIGYSYFCLCLAIFLSKKIIQTKNRPIKLLTFVFALMIPTGFLIYLDKIPQSGIWATVVFLIFDITAFLMLILTFYNLYKIRKIIFKLSIFLIGISILIWTYVNKEDKTETISKETDSIFLIQPWQLNSRYKINNVVKFLKIDLDKDGKDELAAVTSYDKLPTEVFYYAGFYRYNPITEMWDEYYGEELNILNYGLTDTSKIENVADFNEKIIKMWSTEFTTLENIGDTTGDGCPEIVFSSLLQGKYFDNYIIVAQSGESHFRFKIFTDQNTMAEIVSEDRLLIEKYFEGEYSLKKIYEWDKAEMGFRLLETQKVKTPIEETPKASPEIEGLTS